MKCCLVSDALKRKKHLKFNGVSVFERTRGQYVLFLLLMLMTVTLLDVCVCVIVIK